MLSKIPLTFIDFNFLQCYAAKDEYYEWEDIEAKFGEGILRVQHLSCDPNRGPVLTLYQLNESLLPANEYAERIMLQILNIMPFKMGDYHDAPLILHEMEVVTWAIDSPDTMTTKGIQAYKCRRLKYNRLFIVLECWLAKSIVHCYRKGHLAFCFKQEIFRTLLNNSKVLKKSLDDFVETSTTVICGLTLQQAYVNCRQNHKAFMLHLGVYGQVDLAFVSLNNPSTSTDISLNSLHLILTDDFEKVLPPKEQYEESEDS